MSITKEQVKTFNKHFKIIEETIDFSKNITDFEFSDIENFKDEPKGDEFFMWSSWDLGDCEVISSIGYFIAKQNKYYQKIKQIYNFNDILDFIEKEMEQYLK